MGLVIKRDWEIVRIFLILAILTLGFVWGVQSLILTPTNTAHVQNYSVSGLTPADTGMHKSEVIIQGLEILPERALTITPLREPALSKD